MAFDRRPWSIALLGSALLAPTLAAQEIDRAEIHARVSAWQEHYEIPTLGVGLLVDGEVVLANGFGMCGVNGSRAADEHTLFAIGSISKSFTAAVLGTLVDEGALQWDQTVRSVLDEFQMHDPVATEQMNLIDLLCHRSGLPRHDLVWYASGVTREQMVERLRFLEPNRAFRETWQYQNLMFVTAGRVAEVVAGSSWEELVRERIFTKLGMERSNFSVERMQEDANHSRPFAKLDEEVREIPYRNIDEVGPAGSINSSVHEMLRYVSMHLGNGEFEDEQVLSTASARRMRTPQMVMPGLPSDEVGHSSYGLGLMIDSYRGRLRVHHGGGIDGFSALMTFLPQDGVGVVVLTNLTGHPVTQMLTHELLDRALELEPIDWFARATEEEADTSEASEGEEAEEEAPAPDSAKPVAANAASQPAEESGSDEEGEDEDDGRHAGTSPSHELADYTGKYLHPAYGEATVNLADEALTLSLHGLDCPLEHWHYDVFRIRRYEDRVHPFSGKEVLFRYGRDGHVESLQIPLEPNVADIVFERAPDPNLHDPETLAEFAGEYRFGPAQLLVELQGKAELVVHIQGQGTVHLEPLRERVFRLREAPEVKMEFVRDDDGTVNRLRVHQPGGVVTAERLTEESEVDSSQDRSDAAAQPQHSDDRSAEEAESAAANTEQPAAVPIGKLPMLHRPPPSWKERQPQSSMRLAEWVVAEDPELVCIVYFFGVGGGGGVRANLERWASQIRGPEEPTITESNPAPGVKVSLLDASGTYVAEMQPGSNERHEDDDSRMLAAVVELEGGPLFFKLVGPKDAVGEVAPVVHRWLESVRPGSE